MPAPAPMPPGSGALRDVADVPAEALACPSTLQLAFEGFSDEAFAILERLRAEPHIEQYQREKAAARRAIQEPFGRYRDDLVVNGVLPNRLALETERGVFSRLLKNDFGAGGCHHHYWMAFYRPGLRRTQDVQIGHSLWPDGLRLGLWVGSHQRAVFAAARAALVREPERALEMMNAVLRRGGWTLGLSLRGAGEDLRTNEPLAAPPDFARLTGFRLGRRMERADVIAAGPEVVRWALKGARRLWPLYRFFVDAAGRPG